MVTANELLVPVVALLEVRLMMMFSMALDPTLIIESTQNHLLFDTNLALVLAEPQDCTRICEAKAVVSLLDPTGARPTDVEISTRTQ
jgi:hypothetical protein